MHTTFQNSLWQITVTRPWRVREVDECIEITQPEGAGALHISSALKEKGMVSESETRTQLEQNCPESSDFERAKFGDFVGYGAEYVEWSDSRFWKKWFVASGRVLLFISYNCSRGDEDLEFSQVCEILSSLELRR